MSRRRSLDSRLDGESFRGLRPEDVKGLGWWFWYKDGLATCTNMYNAVIVDHDCIAWYEYIFKVVLIIIAPLIYMFMPWITVFNAERNILEGMEQGPGRVRVFSKSAIEYFTIMANLRRKEDG